MPNPRLRKGRPSSGSPDVKVLTNTVARTDTSAKSLFTLPAGSVPIEWLIDGEAASNAGSSAVIDIGKSGAAQHFVAAHDVKTAATGLGNQQAKGLKDGESVGASNVVVQGKYTESGTASNTGGPWRITCLYQ